MKSLFADVVAVLTKLETVPFLSFFKCFKYLLIIIFISSCLGKQNLSVDIKQVSFKQKASVVPSVTNVQIVDNQIIISGKHLASITKLKVTEGSSLHNLAIESKTDTTLTAKVLSNVVFSAGKILNLILSSAEASTGFTINFSLCDSLLGGKRFACNAIPNDKEVLSYNANSGEWEPRPVNGMSYKGAWDASDSFPNGEEAGEYYIVSDAHGIYDVGDWIVFNGNSFDKIDNSQAIVSVFGRTGAITAGLNDLTDITISSPLTGQILKFNGSKWVNDTLSFSEADPSVKGFAKLDLPICGNGEVLKSDGSSFSCIQDASGAGAFSGAASKVIVTNTAGELEASALESSVLSHLSNVSSDIQTQIDSKFNQAGHIDWDQNGLQTIHSSRLSLGLGNASKALITNNSGFISTSSVTETELGYLVGVTGNLQGQLNAKISTETDPGVQGFAKSALPICTTNQVLKSDGLDFSCVTLAPPTDAYAGTPNRLVLTNGTNGELTTSAVTNTEVGFLVGVSSNIQAQLNNKQSADKILTNQQDAGSIHPFGTASGNTGEFRFYELLANGLNYTGFKSPDALSNNIIYTLPAVTPVAGQILSSSATGELSWIAPPSAPVTSVNTKTGVISLTTSDISEGSNLYFTGARALGAQVSTPTLTNSAVVNGDTLQVSVGKLQAQINNKEGSITSGSTAQYYRGDKTWATFGVDVRGVFLDLLSTATASVITAADSVLSAFGKLQAQVSAKAALTNLTQVISAQMVTGLQTPVAGSDAANKAYVDSFAGAWTNNGSNIYRASGKVGIGVASPSNALSVNGMIESLSGGVRFPDGSVQTTASATTLNTWNLSESAAQTTLTTTGANPLGQMGTKFTTPTGGGVDDGFYTFTLPFPINFNGTYYTSISVGTNSYVTFGGSSTAYSGLNAGNPNLNKIMINSADRSSNSVWFDSSPSSFSIRYEGGCGTSPGTTQVWEIRGNSVNDKQIKVNIISLCGGGLDMVASATTSLTSFTAVANTAFDLDYGSSTAAANTIYRLVGNVGIGSANPGIKTKLLVNGQISSKSGSIATKDIDFSVGNSVTTSFDCSADLSLDSIRDGGSYVVAVTSTNTNQCNFGTTVIGDDAGLIAVRYSPANGPRTASSHTLYRLSRVGAIIYVSWSTGFL